MNRTKVLNDVQNDLTSSKTSRHLVEQEIARWKRAYDGKPYGNEQKHRSSVVSKDIQKHVETMRPSLIEPFLGSDTLIKAKATNSSSTTSASYNQHILNYQWNSQFDKLCFIDTISSVLPKEGTVFVRTGWERKEDVKIKKLTNMTQEQIMAAGQLGEISDIKPAKDKGMFDATLTNRKLIKNCNTAIVCRNEDVYTDPSANGNLEDAKFIFHEYTASISDVLKNKNLYPDAEAVRSKLIGHVSNRDPDSVLESERYANTQRLGTDTSYVSSSDMMKKLQLVEYWGEAETTEGQPAEQIVCVYVKNTKIVLRMETNPYPDNAIPFVSTPYTREAFTTWGKALAQSMEDNQKVRTAIIRGFIDNFALANNGQKFFQKGAIDYPNMRKLAAGYRFIEMNNLDGMEDGSFNEMPQSAYNMYNMVEAESEVLSGVTKNMTGLDSATVGRTASGVNMVMSAAQRRTLMTVRNISSMLQKMFRKWAAYNAEFLDDETSFDINGEFLQLNRADLQGQHDFEVRIGMDAENQGKMQQINNLMQQLSADGEQGVDQEIRKELVAEFFDAMGKNEMAEKIRKTPPPQPSPEQIQMQQLEMQIKEMQAALEAAKVEDTQAAADLKDAQADKILSELGKENADLQKQVTDLQMKQAEHDQTMEMNEETHDQKIVHDSESHELKMALDAQSQKAKEEQAAKQTAQKPQ